MPSIDPIPNCTSLQQIRENIDRIDHRLVALIAERGLFVRQAARFKTTMDEVEAPQRVEQVISKVTELAKELGASPSVVEQVYRAMISAFIHAELAEYNSIQDASGPT
ncbi:MAG: chorismate mutase [Acidobacteria bacterium]|nr:chorismate mutase [Acidobacteriota bacterium]MBI3489921.1 chorismate mutase [Acidobacteriota bacterium]